MTKQMNKQFNDDQLRQLLYELDQHEGEVELSDVDIAEFEALPQYEISPEQDVRQRAKLEDLRQDWLADTKTMGSLLGQIKTLGTSNREFAQRLGLDPAILLKLERRQIVQVPQQAIIKLAHNLECSFQSLYLYLTQPPKGMEQMAASSKGKPAETTTESWAEAISNSQMTSDNKNYWLTLDQ